VNDNAVVGEDLRRPRSFGLTLQSGCTTATTPRHRHRNHWMKSLQRMALTFAQLTTATQCLLVLHGLEERHGISPTELLILLYY